MTTHPEDYAFPVAPGDVPYWQPGMSLRDWFAGQALVGMVANPNNVDGEMGQVFARTAYIMADAMIAARAKGDE